MGGLTIEPATYGGFVVYERAREPGVSGIAFAGALAECLAFIEGRLAITIFGVATGQ